MKLHIYWEKWHIEPIEPVEPVLGHTQASLSNVRILRKLTWLGREEAALIYICISIKSVQSVQYIENSNKPL
jgi:hypothetical protein